MCQNTLLSAAEECGLKTRFCFEPVSAAPRLAKSLLPYGKVLLLADESVSAVLHSMRGQFAGFKIFCVVLGGGDRAEGLFSLPDDVRLCVAVGRRSIAAARFFCTLRGAFLLAVPDMLYQEGMLSSASSCGYPVEEPDIVLFDENFVGGRGRAACIAAASLSALCAEDIDIDAVFSGERKEYGYRQLCRSAELAKGADDASRFAACALQEIALRPFSRYPSLAFFRQLSRGGEKVGQSAFAALVYAVRQYAALFENARLRPYFVADYAARVRRAAQFVGREAFENIQVPTAEVSFARARTFAECREHFCVAAGLLRGYAERVRECYYLAGGIRPAVRTDALQEAYSLSCDLSPLLSAGALARDFGLPNMCGGIMGQNADRLAEKRLFG